MTQFYNSAGASHHGTRFLLYWGVLERKGGKEKKKSLQSRSKITPILKEDTNLGQKDCSLQWTPRNLPSKHFAGIYQCSWGQVSRSRENKTKQNKKASCFFPSKLSAWFLHWSGFVSLLPSIKLVQEAPQLMGRVHWGCNRKARNFRHNSLLSHPRSHSGKHKPTFLANIDEVKREDRVCALCSGLDQSSEVQPLWASPPKSDSYVSLCSCNQSLFDILFTWPTTFYPAAPHVEAGHFQWVLPGFIYFKIKH